ncbi:low molecular weight protein-tyrosine-phosphatase [Hydrogenophaga sp.]|uniref:low molecular weight protein-tyrosine-phosphatase n=1 Tax=Hydrogenophaga sp. TaxID=1904254 RepID=UPI002731AE29|nr:low molecular weight protein-tyrosine-phosphatase [Hydrogenophaga sp.]MDP2074946.1 low molecular weight protein-tyrosine-phosphatase [Hydrogenophaga sp.]MDP3109960.1 low molecular weight protein-tyrosine-phosphatase [Hydrogenophaga sp.]MDP3348025.1 low molecular weight protein-tyrosine-phosphatase [Hydrogenophaga sp.]MDZ4281896.1 low molecular weight protein-tyrosine-phosphatase [Hydrogenophaga sp.]MDZ4396380.1 low molecular weight protein-tyrosine-phosphatase [Hydrogenophaga sp.]
MSQLKPTPRRILLVCIGNRVRSPLAQGFLRAELDSAGLSHVQVDSAGTNVWPGSEPPDREAIFEAARAGIHIEHLRSRELTEADFEQHDAILAMDWDSHALAEGMAPAEHRHKVGHLAQFARREKVTTIPDPAATGYARTLACIQDACEGWVVNHLVRRPAR